MANPSKAKGTLFESQLRDYLREIDYDAERLRTTGALDEGDLAVKEGTAVCVIEAKATAALDLSGFTSQALVERDNYARARGLDPAKVLPVVVIKRRGKGVADAYVVTTVKEFFSG